MISYYSYAINMAKRIVCIPKQPEESGFVKVGARFFKTAKQLISKDMSDAAAVKNRDTGADKTRFFRLFRYSVLTSVFLFSNTTFADIPLYWWKPNEGTIYEGTNFGDELSVAVIEKIIEKPIKRAQHTDRFKLLGIGPIIQFAKNDDVIWGSGMNGKDLNWKSYPFQVLDVRTVRGPLTQQFLMNLGIKAPSVFGDPALLLPFLFPEFQVSLTPKYKYIVIPHISEIAVLPKNKNGVLPTAPWREIVGKILQSEFVISSSLHGIIVAEAFGIPARFLRLTNNEPDFKYEDYYLGTGRPSFTAARSIKEALEMGGEPPPICDLDALLDAFPYDYFF